jgi:hypothetical protein
VNSKRFVSGYWPALGRLASNVVRLLAIVKSVG